MIQKGLSTTGSSSGLLFNMSSMLNIFTLFFPIFLFSISLFFLYHGITRLSASKLSGTVKSKSPAKDPRGNDCVYSRLEVDYYTGDHQQWKQLYSEEQRLGFFLNNYAINIDSADIRLKPKVAIGYLNREKGFFENVFDDFSSKVSEKLNNAVRDVQFGVPIRPSQKLDNATMKILLNSPKLKKALTPHIRKQFRITEYLLAPGAKITIGVSGNILRPFLLTDQGDVAHIIREKSYLTIFIGCLFVLLSFTSFVLIILSF